MNEINDPTLNVKHISNYSNYDEKFSLNVELSNSMLLLVKMSFVYSAIMDGWRVEKLSNSKFCFTKKNVFKGITIRSFFEKHLNKQLFSK